MWFCQRIGSHNGSLGIAAPSSLLVQCLALCRASRSVANSEQVFYVNGQYVPLTLAPPAEEQDPLLGIKAVAMQVVRGYQQALERKPVTTKVLQQTHSMLGQPWPLHAANVLSTSSGAPRVTVHV